MANKKSKFYLKKSFKENYMKLRDWSVQDVADMVEMKKQQVSPILNGRLEPSVNFLHRLCDAIQIPVEDLVETKWGR